MSDQITFFSGYNTENDLLPPDTAKDLYQIIISLGSKVDQYNGDVQQAINDLKNHIKREDNPHKLTMSDFSKDDLFRTLYNYYKNYYNSSNGTLAYNPSDLINIFRQYPLAMLECIRRISLNDLHVIDGLLMYNKDVTRSVVKNYYTNDINISEIGGDGFANIPTYSFSRQWCGRDLPYLYTLHDISVGTSNLIIPRLKDYFEKDQGNEVTNTDIAYGVPFGNKSMLSNDSMFISWDERYIYGDQRDTGYVLAVTPYHKALFFKVTLEKGKYRIDLTVADIEPYDFTILLPNAQTFSFYSDRAACVFVFNNDPIGFISYLQDGFVNIDTIDIPFKYTGDYTSGRIYTGEIIDTDVLPTALADPDRVGRGYPSRTVGYEPMPTVAKLKTLDVARFSAASIGTGYAPNIRYIAERLAQL